MTPLAQLLETLRLALHLVFAALLVVSLVQFFASDAADAAPARRITVIVFTALLAVVYLARTVAGPGSVAWETEILRALATGASNRQVASSLFISLETVKTHLIHI